MINPAGDVPLVSREGMSRRTPPTPATQATPADVEPVGAVVPQVLRFRGPKSKDKPKDKPKAKSTPAPAAAPPRVPYAYADEEDQLKVGFATAEDAEPQYAIYAKGPLGAYVPYKWEQPLVVRLNYSYTATSGMHPIIVAGNPIEDPQQWTQARGQKIHDHIKAFGYPSGGITVTFPDGSVKSDVVTMKVHRGKAGGVVKTLDLSSLDALKASLEGK